MTKQDNTQAELREKIRKAQYDLAGRRATHLQVARRIGWTPKELDGVHEGDQIIFESDILALITSHTNKAVADVLDRLGETIPFSNSTSDELDKSNTHLDSRSQQYWSAYNKGYISMSDQTKQAIQAERQKLTIKEVL